MPAGFKYDLKPIEKTMPELCRFETVIDVVLSLLLR